MNSFNCDRLIYELEFCDHLLQLQSSFVKFQGNNGCSSREIAEAEMMKYQLLAAKQDLDKKLASTHRMRAHLQMELESVTHMT